MLSEVIFVLAKDDKNTKTLITHGKHGEIEDIQEVQTLIHLTKRHFKKGEFYMTAKLYDDLVWEKDYGRTELRTLIALKRRLDFNNRIKGFRQSELAEELKTGQSNISKTLKRLENDGLIKRDGVDYYFDETYLKYAGDENIRKQQNKNKDKENKVTKKYQDVTCECGEIIPYSTFEDNKYYCTKCDTFLVSGIQGESNADC